MIRRSLAATQELTRESDLAGTSVRAIHVDKDKISRALPVASRAEAGKVKLIRGNWLSDFLDEATSFPNGVHDDQVDAVSGAFQMIAAKRRVLYAFLAFIMIGGSLALTIFNHVLGAHSG